MLLFHAYDSIMFIFLHIIMMRMKGTGTRDGGESRGLTPTERGTRGWRRGGQGGDGGRKTAAREGGAGEGGGRRRKNGIRLNGEA